MLTPPPLKNDCFAMPTGSYWTPVDDALALLKERLTCVVGTEETDVRQAAGRVLAKDVVAQRSHPPTANSAVDGYGFLHSSLTGNGPFNIELITGRAAAGVPFDGVVPQGKAIRILTGAALPDGVDTVILEEDVATDGANIAFNGPIKQGANARQAGEDVRRDDTVLQKARVLTAADVALLSAVGASKVTVHKRLKVALISTGDELVEINDPIGNGQIFDANRPMLSAICAVWGFDVVDLGAQKDDRDAIADALDRAAEQADVILTSGGASAGDEDHLSALLTERAAMSLWRIAMKPGRPLALGLWQNTPVFGLPGNPVAAFVCTLVFARPAMQVLSGANWTLPQGFMIPAAFEKSKKEGRREYLRARMRDGQAEVFKSEGSGRISSLSWAEGLVQLADHTHDIHCGDPVLFIPFSQYGL